MPTLRTVGPAEPDTEALAREVSILRAELVRCEAAVRTTEAEKGELLGQLAEMRVQLGRARQAQEWAETSGPTIAERTRLRWANGVATVRRAAGSIRRRTRGARPPV